MAFFMPQTLAVVLNPASGLEKADDAYFSIQYRLIKEFSHDLNINSPFP
jgi:hypothetical protein